jgi:PII-like signaling protein
MEIVRAKKLIVHTSEAQRYGRKSAYAAVLDALDRAGIRAATAVRATAGFGADGKMATTMIEALSYDLPVVVEATDTPERIDAVLSEVLEIVADGVVELCDVEIAVASLDAGPRE